MDWLWFELKVDLRASLGGWGEIMDELNVSKGPVDQELIFGFKDFESVYFVILLGLNPALLL